MKSSAVAAAALQQQAAALQQQAAVAAALQQQAASAARQQAAAAEAAARQQAAMDAAALRIAEQKAEEEREFRYATDPVYRKFIDDKRAAAEAEQAAAEVKRAARLEAERAAAEANRAAAEASRAAVLEATRVAEEAERVARVEAARIAEAARMEAARLKRLRNQQRAANIRKVFVLTGRDVAVVIVGVFVWAPQLAVGWIRTGRFTSGCTRNSFDVLSRRAANSIVRSNSGGLAYFNALPRSPSLGDDARHLAAPGHSPSGWCAAVSGRVGTLGHPPVAPIAARRVAPARPSV